MESKEQKFKHIFSQDRIDINALYEEAFSGCPEKHSYRSLTWRILLRLINEDRNTWDAQLSKMRNLYQQYVQELIVLPQINRQGEGGDHPLNPNPDSQWARHFEDNEMLHQIDKDCRRLCPDLSFFQQANPVNPGPHISLKQRVEISWLESEEVNRGILGIKAKTPVVKKRRDSDMHRLAKGQEAHWEVCERILFIYTKLNTGQGYVQGMNEVLGPIYYVMASDPDQKWALHAEPDAFFCFTAIMAEIRDHFIKELDTSNCGIQSRMQAFQMRLKSLDVPLHTHLTTLGLKSEFYVFRWLTLLLSQEYRLPDLLRVWDSLLSDRHRFDFLLDVCCAMAVLIRQDLLTGDFSDCMRLLQNYPYSDVRLVLTKAHEFYMRRSNHFPEGLSQSQQQSSAASTPDSDLFSAGAGTENSSFEIV